MILRSALLFSLVLSISELGLASYGRGNTCVCTQVHLADQKTVMRTTEIVRGVLSVISDEGKEFKVR